MLFLPTCIHKVALVLSILLFQVHTPLHACNEDYQSQKQSTEIVGWDLSVRDAVVVVAVRVLRVIFVRESDPRQACSMMRSWLGIPLSLRTMSEDYWEEE